VSAEEAGAFIIGSKDAPHDGVVTEAILTRRRYLVIRGAGNAVRVGPQYQYLTEILTRELTSIHNILLYGIHSSIRT
jgi:hypothetical protein